jgi:hypothetical protein
MRLNGRTGSVNPSVMTAKKSVNSNALLVSTDCVVLTADQPQPNAIVRLQRLKVLVKVISQTDWCLRRQTGF